MNAESEKQKDNSQAEQAEGEAPIEPGENPPALSAEETIQNLEIQVADLTDQNLRNAAEFVNYRKRMDREKQKAIEFANQELLKDLLPILDIFEQVFKSGETLASASPEFASFLEGVSMTEKLLLSLLEKWGLKRYGAVGEIFDPNRYEAIMEEKSAEVQEPLVQDVARKGYTLKDRIIRIAQAKVLMPLNPGALYAGVEDTKNEE